MRVSIKFCLSIILISGLKSFAQVPDTNWFSNLEFRSLGPNRGGRSAAVCGSVVDRNLFYMGSVGGGVWRTKNGGHSWENISDGFFGGSIGSVAVAPSDENVIYVGTGEETLRGNVSSGEGMWRSVDAGKTWTFIGLKDSRHIPQIAVHPKNPDVAIAAVLGDLYKDSEMRGLYRTEDGGKSWKQVQKVSNQAGFNEVTFDPMNHRIMFAASWNVRRTPYGFSSGGEGSALWRSKDEGKTWENIMNKPGLPKGIIGKITISASMAQRDLVYAMIEHSTQGGLYKSTDGGDSWQLVNSSADIRQRAWYFFRVYADTKNADVVYVMNVRFEKSTDGGRSFHPVNTPHVDHHGLWIDPNDNSRMIVANDGGAQVSYNGGLSWSSYHNQPTEQFYRVVTDNFIPYRIYGAQQDNSSMRVDHLTGQYENTAGGESAHHAIDPRNPEIVYGGNYGGYLTRYNHKMNEQRGINVWPDNPMGAGAEAMKYRFQWNFPIFFSPHDSSLLYTASNHLHISRDGGNSWKVISPDLTRNDSAKLVSSGGPITKDNTGVEYYCTIFAAVESKLEKGLLYTGSDDGLIYISKDAGEHWDNITPKDLPEWSMINSLETDPFSKGCLYAVATTYKSGDNRPMIWVTKDYGKTWKNCVKGIAADHFVRVVRSDLKIPGLLYAGTERELYISYDFGEHWQSFQRNLPLVPITDITLKDNDLIIATQGRGFWIIDDVSAIQKAGNKIESAPELISVTGDYITYAAWTSAVFYLPDSVKNYKSLLIDIIDFNGNVVRTWSKTKAKDTLNYSFSKGVNYFKWNLRYPDAYVPDDMVLWWAHTGGPRAAPGEYTFRLTIDGNKSERKFELKHNPNDEASEQEARKKFDFLIEVVNKIDTVHHAIDDMHSIQKQLNSFLKNHPEITKSDSLYKESKRLIKLIDSLENDLYQTKLKSEQDPINYPIKLNNKLAHLNSLVSMGSYGPTDQAVQVKDELIAEVDSRLELFKKICEADLVRLNRMINQRNLPVILAPSE
ncbi:MAG: glycosyl hydrolase [Bacteroidetes bacterium]|nr:glycosyl hydrolase [Bacteroidota bacterium]